MERGALSSGWGKEGGVRSKRQREAEGTQGEPIFNLTWLFCLSLGEAIAPQTAPGERQGGKPPQSFCFYSISFAGFRDPFTLSEHAIREGKSPLSGERGSGLFLKLGVLALGAFSQAELERVTLSSILRLHSPSLIRKKVESVCSANREGNDGGRLVCWKNGDWGAEEGVQALR